MLNNEQCSLVDSCIAPLCPLDDSLNKAIWYRGEEICRGRKFQSLPWIRKQKKIVRRQCDNTVFFTAGMLQEIDRVTKGLKGADPDIYNSEKKWLEKRCKRSLTKARNKAEEIKKLVVSPL